MKISLNLVLETLEEYTYASHIADGAEGGFSRLCLMPEAEEEIAPGRLYVGVLSQALTVDWKELGAHCVCIRDRIQDHQETEDALSGLIIINENVSLRRVYTCLQDLFYNVSEWVNRMNRYAYEKRPLQDILELSESVIGNFISVSDSALSLMSYTRHIPIDDEICLKLLKNGFHPEDTIEAFKRTGQFEIWDKTVGLVINTLHDLSPYDLCSKVFKFHNTYYVHVVMTCNRRPLTPGVKDLFQMLVDILDIYVERDWKKQNYCRHIYDSLLIDLIENKLSDPCVVSERARHVSLPVSGPYKLYLMDFETLDKIPIGRIGLSLSETFPGAKVTIYQNRILILVRYEERDDARAEADFLDRLSGYLEEYDALCGVSTCFDELSDIALAYEQGLQALKYSGRIRDSLLDEEKQTSRVIEYEKHFLLIMAGESPDSGAMWQSTRYYRMLCCLHDHDSKHSTNNIQLLYTYLHCDSRAPEASALLHMHRNNVLYRISRIEEMLGVRLSDEEVKRGLLDSYKLLQLYGFR